MKYIANIQRIFKLGMRYKMLTLKLDICIDGATDICMVLNLVPKCRYDYFKWKECLKVSVEFLIVLET